MRYAVHKQRQYGNARTELDQWHIAHGFLPSCLQDKYLQTSLIELKTPSSPVSGFVGFLDAFLLNNNEGSRLEKLFTTRSCQYEGFKLNIVNLSSGENNVHQKAAVCFLGVKLYKPSIYTISNSCQFFFKGFLQCTLTYALM